MSQLTEEKVRAGLEWLNKVRPGAAEKIDLRRLDIYDEFNCVAGQVFGSYYNLPIGLEEAVRYGFQTAGNAGLPSDGVSFLDLQLEWERVLTEMKGKNGAQQTQI